MSDPPAPAPSLDEFARNPDRAATLPLDALLELQRQLRYLEADVERHLAERLAQQHGSDGRPDRRLDVDAAAAKLSVSTDWLYRHADELAFTVRLGGTLGFSERGIDDFLRQQGQGRRRRGTPKGSVR